ncbi:hypothetical protein CGK15_23900 [Vibrio parahaemolyticus]|uniref:DUF3883 domain-containing protein n=1 Tax=Vibrio parahaemolyticus TaxID=670 RepID=UPI001121732A|nr:DUF3883 domain-containing protein [Vibrio parahaemolyticus]TOA94315.1 hypothetical protein CGK15_23900 [Vibrio parahaemolyticus]
MKMIICNVAWMKHYDGINDSDYPINGGKYIDKNGYGHEVLNFQKNGKYCYGYVQANNLTINISRIEPNAGDYIDDVLVVWRSRSNRGSVVIGWYENARVYRTTQEPNDRRSFHFNGEDHFPEYLIKAKSKDCTLLAPQQRLFPVPVTHKGFGSQTFVSFLEVETSEVKKFKRQLMTYISRVKEGQFSLPNKGKRGKIDHETKLKIEKTAVDLTIDYYVQLGYIVDSVEKDNVGYDLKATSGNKTLYIEVKGTSAKDHTSANVCLTPNEYKTSKTASRKYRICIVVNCLSEPELFEFTWDPEKSLWFSEHSLTSLKVTESISANLSIC